MKKPPNWDYYLDYWWIAAYIVLVLLVIASEAL